MTTKPWHPVLDETETTPAGIRLPDGLWADLTSEANRLGITRNQLIERLLTSAARSFLKAEALPGFGS